MRMLWGLGLIGIVSGCRVYANPQPTQPRILVVEEEYHPAPTGTVVAVEKAHVHDDVCGHYWYNGSWYHWAGHRHAPDCGHIRHDGHWVLAGEVVIRPGHVHDDHCGHYFFGGSWYYMAGHQHGSGCGHTWNGRVWVSTRL